MYFVPSKNKAEEVRCSHAPWRAMHVCESTRGCNKTPFSLSLRPYAPSSSSTRAPAPPSPTPSPTPAPTPPP